LAAEERARLNGEEVDNEIQKGIFKENLDNAKKVINFHSIFDSL
jgi:cancer susceptibility candidate protein 1